MKKTTRAAFALLVLALAIALLAMATSSKRTGNGSEFDSEYGRNRSVTR